MIKTLLAIIVSMVMAMGGTTSMPALPETEQILTISDFTLNVNGETAALDPAAQLSAALGSEELDLHFQINMPDGTLMPVSGKLTDEGVQFILSETGKAYSISEDTIYELLGITEEDVALGMLENTAEVMKLTRDPEFGKDISAKMLTYLTSLADADPEAVEIDMNGTAVQAEKWIINTDITGIYGCYDVLMDSGNANMDSYLQNLLKLLNELVIGQETSVSSFAELAENMGVDIPVYMELIMNDDQSYANILLNMAVENEMQMTSETVVTPEGTNSTMEMNTLDETNPVIMVMDMNVSGSSYAPESVLLTFGITSHDEYSFDNEPEEEGGEPTVFTSVTDTNASGSFSWFNTDGLSDMTAVFGVDTDNHIMLTGENGYDTSGSSAVELNMQYSETAEEDGSISGHFDFDMLANDMPVSLSLNINRSEGAYADYFAGYETVELTGDTESEAYNALSSDLLCLIADVNALSGDESLQQLSRMITAEETEFDVEYAAGDDDYDVMPDGDYEQQLADAMAAFRGTPVNYTAPDGYVIDYVYASDEGDYISVDYADPATGDMFELTLSAYDEEETQYEYLPIGAGEALTGPVAELQMYSGAYYAAIIRLPLGEAMIIFPENAAFESVQSILAGFELK